jgi:hypothetical protein
VQDNSGICHGKHATQRINTIQSAEKKKDFSCGLLLASLLHYFCSRLIHFAVAGISKGGEMFKRTAKWLVTASIGLLFSANAHAAVFQVSKLLEGQNPQTDTYPFFINSVGTYNANLLDIGSPVPFSQVTLAIFSGTGSNPTLLGQIYQPGSFDFGADHPGFYTAGVFATPGAYIINNSTRFAGTYEVTIAAVPEPEVWAMMLIGAGLIGYQVRRKSKAGPAKNCGMA